MDRLQKPCRPGGSHRLGSPDGIDAIEERSLEAELHTVRSPRSAQRGEEEKLRGGLFTPSVALA